MSKISKKETDEENSTVGVNTVYTIEELRYNVRKQISELRSQMAENAGLNENAYYVMRNLTDEIMAFLNPERYAKVANSLQTAVYFTEDIKRIALIFKEYAYVDICNRIVNEIIFFAEKNDKVVCRGVW